MSRQNVLRAQDRVYVRDVARHYGRNEAFVEVQSMVIALQPESYNQKTMRITSISFLAGQWRDELNRNCPLPRRFRIFRSCSLNACHSQPAVAMREVFLIPHMPLIFKTVGLARCTPGGSPPWGISFHGLVEGDEGGADGRAGSGVTSIRVNVHRKKAQEAQSDFNAHEINSFPCQRGEFPQMAGSR